MRSRLAAFNNRAGDSRAATGMRGGNYTHGDTEIHPVKRDIFPRKSEMSAATLAEKLKNWGITFDGTTDPITFIQQLEERATAYEVDVEKMTQAIPGLLTDTAEHWFRTRKILDELQEGVS